MAANLNETPGAERLHIGIFGRTNSGKSAFEIGRAHGLNSSH